METVKKIKTGIIATNTNNGEFYTILLTLPGDRANEIHMIPTGRVRADDHVEYYDDPKVGKKIVEYLKDQGYKVLPSNYKFATISPEVATCILDETIQVERITK